MVAWRIPSVCAVLKRENRGFLTSDDSLFGFSAKSNQQGKKKKKKKDHTTSFAYEKKKTTATAKSGSSDNDETPEIHGLSSSSTLNRKQPLSGEWRQVLDCLWKGEKTTERTNCFSQWCKRKTTLSPEPGGIGSDQQQMTRKVTEIYAISPTGETTPFNSACLWRPSMYTKHQGSVSQDTELLASLISSQGEDKKRALETTPVHHMPQKRPHQTHQAKLRTFY